MLKIDLPRLARDGSLSYEAVVPPDDPLWEGSDLRFGDDVLVRGRASLSGSGEIVVRMHVEGVRSTECRRCLDPVRIPIERDFILVFGDSGDPDESRDDEESGVRPMTGDAVTLELGDALREELILSTDRWVECRPDCAGLCPVCGVNRNEETCDCSPDEPDPRWDALRALKRE